MQQGLVSIIIPVYNTEKYLEEAIQSVLLQTYTQWELLIVDDASTDGTLSIAEESQTKDSRIKVLSLVDNGGKAEAINSALPLVKGQYLAFLDGDDIWMPEKLEHQIGFMRKRNYPITCTAYIQVNEKGDKTGRVFKALEKVNYKRLLLDCPVGNSSVVYDISLIGVCEVPNIRKRCDDALWLQILQTTPFIYGLNEVLMKYRLRGKSLSFNKIELIKYHWVLYRRIENMSVYSSVFHILYWCLIKVVGIK